MCINKIIESIENDRIEDFEYLVNNLTTVDIVVDGQSLLELCIVFKRKTMIKWLLNLGADPNIKASGSRPLQWAAYINNVEMIELLINAGASTKWELNDEDTSIHMAVLSNSKESLTILCEKAGGKDVINEVKEGNTPLMISVENQNYEIMKYLLQQGANPNIGIRGLVCSTPLGIAIQKKDYKSVEILTSYNKILCSKYLDYAQIQDEAIYGFIEQLVQQCKCNSKCLIRLSLDRKINI